MTIEKHFKCSACGWVHFELSLEAVVVLGEHDRDTVVSVRKHDIALVSLREVPDEYRETYETVAQDDAHDTQGVLLG